MIGPSSSIRVRLFLFALAGIAVALSLAAYGLMDLFGRYLDRRLAQELDGYIGQLAGNLRVDQPGGGLRLALDPTDPRFQDINSGLYWQVRDETRHTSLRSRSLWDAELPLAEGVLSPGQTLASNVEAPDSGILKLRETSIILSGGRPVRISVGVNRAESDELASGFAWDLVPGLALLGLVLLVGAWIQSGAGLRPISGIGAEVQAVRDRHRRRLGSDVPSEIRPLVDELNRLLEHQEIDIKRAQDRAADLAHGLKTPLTALASDIARLRDRGERAIADDIDAVAIRMRRIVERELVRVRQRYQMGSTPPVPVVAVAETIAGILKRTPAGEIVVIDVTGETALAAAVDRDDLNEVLGNLMENAVRHAATRVEVVATRTEQGLLIEVGDDGMGGVPDDLSRLTERGRRHDEKGGSAGLGLAIASDILAIYGQDIQFLTSRLGGLGVRFHLPTA
ncbi:sensor histidine kinase [Mesorhizobium comanense]|uniref:sensor histidine kinase n=1 Tax=Mesorhizobium comanense TaxID=2502215 RepID=UPI0010F63615|nr:HAMP domain-containing sensor histidine kinase [Mesorhizobium comanense]